MYAIRSYYAEKIIKFYKPIEIPFLSKIPVLGNVITSYSIHYTKLHDIIGHMKTVELHYEI